jgi:TPR repeat protein
MKRNMNAIESNEQFVCRWNPNSEYFTKIEICTRFNGAMDYVEAGRYVEAIPLLKILSAQDCVMACYNLSLLYIQGRGVEKRY